MEDVAAQGSNLIVLWISLGIGSCLGLMLTLYNLVVLIGFIREKSEEAASGLSKASWAVGFGALFLGPCGWFVGLIALILGTIESRRIWNEDSTIRSSTPARMGRTNGGMVIALQLFIGAAAAASWLL